MLSLPKKKSKTKSSFKHLSPKKSMNKIYLMDFLRESWFPIIESDFVIWARRLSKYAAPNWVTSFVSVSQLLPPKFFTANLLQGELPMIDLPSVSSSQTIQKGDSKKWSSQRNSENHPEIHSKKCLTISPQKNIGIFLDIFGTRQGEKKTSTAWSLVNSTPSSSGGGEAPVGSHHFGVTCRQVRLLLGGSSHLQAMKRPFGRGTTLLRALTNLTMVISHLLTGMILQAWTSCNYLPWN